MKAPVHILPIIVLAQFAGTSLWFAGNAVLADLTILLGLDANALGLITSAVQFGFISGTLVFAILTIADRFSPSLVFLLSSILGGLFNAAILFGEPTFTSLLTFRFLTGFFLAGIYPVGMKIAADWHEKGLGKALGFLVGALVVGTAFPHLLKSLTANVTWEYVMIMSSAIAVIGGLTIYFFVPNGPLRKKGRGMEMGAFISVFRKKEFRAAAFGYFGHMWELYSFWAFVPFILMGYNEANNTSLNVPTYSFAIIAVGALSCTLGGYLAFHYGSAKVAFFSLLLSGICCLMSPLLITISTPAFLLFLFIWGMTVISDSPQFSTLVASNVETEIKGTALTIVNSIGFAITIISIQLISYFADSIELVFLFLPLAAGPLFGLISMRSLLIK